MPPSAAGCMNTFCARCNPCWCRWGWIRPHPFPQVANKALNFIVRLDGADAFGRANEVAIVKVPRACCRA